MEKESDPCPCQAWVDELAEAVRRQAGAIVDLRRRVMTLEARAIAASAPEPSPPKSKDTPAPKILPERPKRQISFEE